MHRNEKEKSLDQSPTSEGGRRTRWERHEIILTTINNIPIISKKASYLPANSKLRHRAKSLRKSGNLPEIVFWQQVHKGKFYKIDFDRQRVIGNYIVDFYVKSL